VIGGWRCYREECLVSRKDLLECVWEVGSLLRRIDERKIGITDISTFRTHANCLFERKDLGHLYVSSRRLSCKGVRSANA